MAETSATLHRPLMLSPKELQNALKRLAAAFGLKVPVITSRNTAAKPKRKSKT